MKKIITRIPTIAELREIPETMLPAALRESKILLKQIQRIDIVYQPRPKAYLELFKFMIERAPSIKYHNPQLVINRTVVSDGPVIPKVSVYGINNELLDEFDAQKHKTVE
jgi:hypothetical protein